MKISLSASITNVDALFCCAPFYDKKAKKLIGKAHLYEESDHHIANSDSDYYMAFDKRSVANELVIFQSKKKKLSNDEVRRLGAKIVSTSRSRKYKKIAIYADAVGDQLNPLLEGMMLANYEFSKYKTKKEPLVQAVSLLVSNPKDAEARATIKEALAVCDSVNFVRDIVNEPASVIYPETLAKEAQRVVKKVGIKTTIYNEKQLKKMKMDALLSVGHGSHNESRLVTMEYKGGKKNEAPIVIVGKGVTFDSGGLNLKIGAGINLMKFDMAGAATVIGVMKIIGELKPKKNVIGVVVSAENMVNSTATKPNDIINTYLGKSVEVTNTDAEGRLILADALAYSAKNFKPALMINLATLTGACITALGNEISAVMGNDQKVVDMILKAGKETDEKVWQMPLDEKLREKVKGDVSDLKNHTPEARAGTIMGGAFLSYFAEGTPWAHMDIAGSAWSKAPDSYIKKGATGRNVRLLWDLIKKS